MKKLLYIVAPVFFVLVLVTQIDDDLSEEAHNLLGRIDTNGESESYLYLFGIFAEEGEDPVNVGKKLLEEYRKLEDDESYEVNEYPDSKRLTLPEGDEFCKTWEEGCLEYLFSVDIDAIDLLKNYRMLVSRSNRFHEFNEYKTLSKPRINEPFSHYQYITSAERIKVLEAISLYKNGDAPKSIENLLVQFSKLRKSMSLQDNIIGKLEFLMKLSEVIDVLSVIMSNEESDVEAIESLSETEKSFYMIAAREFGMSYYLLENINKHPERSKMKSPFSLGRGLIRIFYKPNMTINAITPIYFRLENFAKLSPSEFAEKIENEDRLSPSTSKLRNYVGNTLIASYSEYEEYAARFFDFDAKLALFNQVHILNRDLDSMKNPYYEVEIPEQSGEKLCFSGPLEDKVSLRCLRLKI